MIYGATGYTGELIAREAAQRGLNPILAGRSEGVKTLGTELGLPVRIFGLEHADQIVKGLEGVRVVLHCAGPFTVTAAPMLEACLRASVHYTDITGEIDVFEQLYARDAECRAADITAISGVGFDVVPTDTVAALLAQSLPNATVLRLGIKALDGISRGTAKTWLEIAARGGSLRRGGWLEPAPIAGHSRMIAFSNDAFNFAVNLPSAELSSAYRTTGIPNIEVFFASSKANARMLQFSGMIRPLLNIEGIRRFVQQQIGRSMLGPNAEARTSGRTTIWGEIEDATGHKVSLRLHGPEGYQFTVLAGLEAVRRLLETDVSRGALTPAQAFGAEFALSIPGTQLERISSETKSG